MPIKFNEKAMNLNLNILNKRKDNIINYKRKMEVNLSFDDKIQFEKNYNQKYIVLTQISKNIIVISRHKYHKKIKTMIKLSKIYENELNLIKNEKKKNIAKENILNLLLNNINGEINRYKNKISMLIIE